MQNKLLVLSKLLKSSGCYNIRKVSYIMKNLVGESNNYYVVAYKDKIWKIPDSDDIDELEGVIKEIKGVINGLDNYHISDIFELENAIVNEMRIDVLVGYVNYNSLMINHHEGYISPTSSNFANKVADFLGLTLSSYSDDQDGHESVILDNGVQPYRVTQRGSDYSGIWFHGTTSLNLPGLVIFGLVPETESKNFIELYPSADPYTYLAANISKAYFHAKVAANNLGGIPIVVSVMIPDKDKIGPDYDIEAKTDVPDDEREFADRYFGSNQYEDISSQYPSRDSVKNSINTGIISYKGRIPFSNFKSILIESDGFLSKYNKTKIANNVKKTLIKAEELGRDLEFLEEMVGADLYTTDYALQEYLEEDLN